MTGAVADAVRRRGWTAALDLVDAAIEPEGDIHATADYRRHLARVLTARALVGGGRATRRRAAAA